VQLSTSRLRAVEGTSVTDSFESDTSVDRSVETGWRKPRFDSEPVEVEDQPTSRMLRTWLVGGRYELYDEVSAGGMGRVYRAVHRDLGRTFALKLLLEGQREREDSRERFFVEARLASALCHPNIVSVTDYGLDEQHGCFLVMEMLEGDTMRARVRAGQLLPRLAFDVIDQLTGAVRYMHARGIVHADIKPENVFLARQEGEPRRRNVVKLIDFGLSFRSGSGLDDKLGGTPPYIAPERLRGAPPSPSCDVYSLGALLYELLTQRTLYSGTLAQMLERSLSGPMPPPPSHHNAAIDGRVDALVMRAVDRDPARRHASAEAFHFELRTVMSMSGLKVRKAPRREAASAGPDARAAIEAALQAVEAGDLPAVQRILQSARQRIDTYGGLKAIGDDDSLAHELTPAARGDAAGEHDGIEDA
jgi:eukaryotic-like serine/threonine-protein kinase